MDYHDFGKKSYQMIHSGDERRKRNGGKARDQSTEMWLECHHKQYIYAVGSSLIKLISIVLRERSDDPNLFWLQINLASAQHICRYGKCGLHAKYGSYAKYDCCVKYGFYAKYVWFGKQGCYAKYGCCQVQLQIWQTEPLCQSTVIKCKYTSAKKLYPLAVVGAEFGICAVQQTPHPSAPRPVHLKG